MTGDEHSTARTGRTASGTPFDRGGSISIWAVALGVGASGWLAQFTMIGGAQAPLLWPPAGVALAAMLMGGMAALPGVVVGMAFLGAFYGHDPVEGVGLAASGIVTTTLAYLILARWVVIDRTLARPADLGWLLLVGVLAAPLLDAAALLAFMHVPGTHDAAIEFFVQCWSGAATGVLAFTPMLLAWRTPASAPRDRRRAWFECLLATGALTLFVLELPLAAPGVPVESLAFPVLIYLGLRHGQRVAATGVTVLCALLVAVVAAGGGPFQMPSDLLGLSAYALTTGGTGLLAAILGRELVRNRDREASDRAVREVLDRSPGMTWVTDRGGACVFTSESWRAFTGLGQDEHHDRGWMGVVHPDDEAAVREQWSSAVRNQSTFTLEYRGVRADGEVRWLLSRASPRSRGKGRSAGHVGTCVDVTERRQYEALARRSERLASVGTLASGIAHEINNPLASILLGAQVARTRTEDDSLKTVLDRIERDAERAGRVTRRVLQFARMDPLERRPLDLIPIIRTSLELAETEASRAGTTLRADLPESLPPVMASAGDLEQVLVNLVLNAIQAEAHLVRCHAATHDERVMVWIEDDGRGPTMDALEHAFDPFFTTRGGAGGTGLGLSVSHGIVEAHDGTISLERRLGGGARVVLEFPVSAADAATEAFQNEHDASPGPAGRDVEGS